MVFIGLGSEKDDNCMLAVHADEPSNIRVVAQLTDEDYVGAIQCMMHIDNIAASE